MTYLIYDLAIVAILVLFFLAGKKKGLILSLCGLVATFVALIGANIASTTLAPVAADALEPHFSAIIQEQFVADGLDQTLEQVLSSDSALADTALAQVLSELGLYESFTDTIRAVISEQSVHTVADLAVTLARVVAESVASVAVFVLAFILISIAWKLLSHALDLAAHLPIIHGVNHLLGAAFGLAEGVVILFLAAWALRVLGGVIPEDVVEQTVLLNFFCTTNPMDLIAAL